MKRLIKLILKIAKQRHGLKVSLLFVLAAMLCLAARVSAGPREYEVKAAFIYNFTQFIEWPKDVFSGADAPFVIAVVGPDPFEGALGRIFTGKSVGSHPIVTKHFDSVDDLGPCQLLFVPTAEDASSRAITEKVGKAPTLIVGESETLLSSGGAIRLYLEDDRMRFQINSEALDVARLKASAKLMQLARTYKK